MTLLAAVMAALATWLVVAPHPKLVGRLPVPVPPTQQRRRRGALRFVVAVTGLAALVAVVTVTLGPGPGAVAAAVGIAGLAAAHLVHRQLQSKAVVRSRREVARAASSLAVQLQAGLVATEALQNAATDWEVLRPGAAAQRLGGDPTDSWFDQSATPGYGGLASLARGWRLCVRSGAPLAPTLQQIAQNLDAEEALGLTVGAELAAPRATGRVMAALPLVGLGLGFAMGGDPVHFLVGTWPGRACLVVGALLAAAGVGWIELIAGRIASQL